MLSTLDDLWGYTGEMFEMSASERALVSAGIAPDRAALKPQWDALIGRVLNDATLPVPAARYMHGGGRAGRHSEDLGHLLAEMQVLARAHPDAVW